MLSDYLVDRIDASGDCWQWTGSVNRYGYGVVAQRGPLRGAMAHRAVWAALVGDPGEALDHRCLNTLCVKPDHLEPVTRAENMRRQYRAKRAACRRGHIDWVRKRDGRRRCRTCSLERNWRRMAAD